jgi:hypothetical protein
MKNILNRQLIFMPILYVAAKMIWGLMPIDKLPEMLRGVLSDLIGPALLMITILLAFIHILWKVPLLEKLAQFLFGTKPNLQGTWHGLLKYEWEGKKVEKTVFLVIKQADGYLINIWLLTDERTSSSIFADIVPYGGGQRIIYTYSNEESPGNKDKNPSHEGYCHLDIAGTSNNLQGVYYTTRKTFGELRFDKRCRKIIMDFDEAQKRFGL